ncbi:MAG: single-stranded DNA-binding protein [Clostridiales bacterium]|nr:single-stranded DNA-binding protein [Clostridiales bacterium]
MQEHAININHVVLSGVICKEPEFSHVSYNDSMYTTYIEVQRLSSQTDILPVTIPEKLMGNNISNGCKITIAGQLRSYNKIIDGKSKLCLTVFAKQVSPFKDYENIIELEGFVCKPPVFRRTPLGKEITDLLVAVNRSRDKSDYIPVIFWGYNAREASQLSVGEKIKISGRCQSRKYEKRYDNGNTEILTAYEVSGFRLETLSTF